MKNIILLLLILFLGCTQLVLADTKIQNPNGTIQYRFSSNGGRITTDNGKSVYEIRNSGKVIQNPGGTTRYKISTDGTKITTDNGKLIYKISPDGGQIRNSNGTTQYRISKDKTKITTDNGSLVYRSNKPLTNAQILSVLAGSR